LGAKVDQRRFCSFLCLALCIILGAAELSADQGGFILRKGFFKEITDAEATNFDIQSFRASGDGSKVVYFGWDGANYSLWVVDGDGQNNTLIETSFHPSSLFRGLMDISDDGSTIVYLRLTSLGDFTPEVTAYDVATMAKTTLLKQVPVSHYGTPENWYIEPQEYDGVTRLSGDGSKFFFINRFGPLFGAGGIWSGFTLYSVNTDGSGFAPVFEAREIQSIPGIGADTTSLVPWQGELAVDGDGSTIALAMSGSWGETDLVVMGGDGSNPLVIQDIRDGAFYGPSLDAAGAKIAYARGGTATAMTTGTFVSNTGLPNTPVQVDPASGYWNVYPHISTDGGSVVYNFDLGGGSSPSIRWAKANGSQRLPATHNVIQGRSPKAMVATGGTTVFTLASTSRDYPLDFKEIMRLDFGLTTFSNMPEVVSITGSPDMSVAVPESPYTFYYTATGSNLREMFSFPFTDDPGLLNFPGFGGFNTNGYLYDDGATNGDVSAGDNIFTDDWVELAQAPPAGVEDFYVRAGVATDQGTAAFADYLCTFGDIYGLIFSDDFESGDMIAWSSATP
jgi:Tol biopolymer transport system component